jgi:hypothetical protein
LANAVCEIVVGRIEKLGISLPAEARRNIKSGNFNQEWGLFGGLNSYK